MSGSFETVRALLVDARPVDHPTARQRGIGRYVTGLLQGLVDVGAPVIGLYGSDAEAAILADTLPDLTVRRWSPQAVRDQAHPGTWYLATQLMLHPIPLDPIPWAVTASGLPVAAVMYDVIPYRFPERYLVDPAARRMAQLRAPLARTVDTMLAISRFAADTAAAELDYPRERIGVIGAGVDARFVPATMRRHPRPERVLPPRVDRYVVAVAGVDERKNTEGLIAAWGQVGQAERERHHLVIACAHNPAARQRWTRCVDAAGVADRVVFTGGVTDDEMIGLLQHARLAVMPSFEEGFGLPVLEAAACGIPVICSNISSLPEVLDEPAATFDPHDQAAIARAIERGLGDETLRADLLAAGGRAVQRWTWTNVATRTLDTLANQGRRWPQELREVPRRIAVVQPADEPAHNTTLAALDSDSEVTIVSRRAVGRFVKPWDFDQIVDDRSALTSASGSATGAHSGVDDAS